MAIPAKMLPIRDKSNLQQNREQFMSLQLVNGKVPKQLSKTFGRIG